jgi:hypothetical protein
MKVITEEMLGTMDLHKVRKYAILRQQVREIFGDPVRRRRVEKAARLSGLVIPNLKGI